MGQSIGKSEATVSAAAMDALNAEITRLNGMAVAAQAKADAAAAAAATAQSTATTAQGTATSSSTAASTAQTNAAAAAASAAALAAAQQTLQQQQSATAQQQLTLQQAIDSGNATHGTLTANTTALALRVTALEGAAATVTALAAVVTRVTALEAKAPLMRMARVTLPNIAVVGTAYADVTVTWPTPFPASVGSSYQVDPPQFLPSVKAYSATPMSQTAAGCVIRVTTTTTIALNAVDIVVNAWAYA